MSYQCFIPGCPAAHVFIDETCPNRSYDDQYAASKYTDTRNRHVETMRAMLRGTGRCFTLLQYNAIDWAIRRLEGLPEHWVIDEKNAVEHPTGSGVAVDIADGALRVRVGVQDMKFAAEHHDSFYLPELDKWALIVSDAAKFAAAVRDQLLEEQEDGTTPVHVMLDKAIYDAVEQGAEGLDYDAMEASLAAEKAAEGL